MGPCSQSWLICHYSGHFGDYLGMHTSEIYGPCPGADPGFLERGLI